MAKKENDALVEETVETAEALVEETTEEEKPIEEKVKKVKTPAKKAEDSLRELVPIKLIKDKQHQEDVIVRVNGYAYQIKRGVTVNVPKYIKEVLDNKEYQEQIALETSLEMQIDPNDRAFQ